MHQELKISPDQTVFFRYNPQGDVLAVRFEPSFEPGTDKPVAELDQVSLTHDAESDRCLGFRIDGVQQLILSSLVRDVLARLRPELESAGAVAPAPVSVEPAAAESPRPEPSPPAQAAPAAEPEPAADRVPDDAPASRHSTTEVEAATPEAVATDPEAEQDAPPKRKTRRRRRRRKQQAERKDDAESRAEAKAPVDSSSTRGSEALPSAERVSPESAPAPAADSTEAVEVETRDAAPAEPERSRHRDPGIQAAVAAVAAALKSGVDKSKKAATEAGVDAAAAAPPAAEAETEAAAPAPVASPDAETDAPAAPQTDAPAARETDVPAALETPETDVPAAPATPETVPDATSEAVSGDPTMGEAEPASAPAPGASSSGAFADLGLHPEVADAIARMGFETPTPIQEQAIPVAMRGRDVVGLAQTGTGKTLAFVAPGLHRILAEPTPAGKHVPRMLILAPTRELTVQVAEEAERIAASSELRVTTIYGGVGMGQQIDELKRGVDLIVATPGRMLDHLRRGNVKIGTVQTLVLDEADRMLDMGFLPDVRTILRFLPETRQTLFFTATMPPEIESLSLEFQNDPATVEIARRKPPENIDQRLYPVGKHLKAPLLVHLLQSDPTMQSVLVFTERKIDADVLSRRLRQEGLSVAVMHGDRRQQDRERALADLADGKVQVLVATNVAARGLDIDDISHVVNYDIPQTVDEYVHRIGRTARAEAEGSAWTLVTVSDEMMVSRIEGALDRKLPRVFDETFDYDVPTPSWAKPSAKDVMAMLNRKQSVADRMRHLGRKR